MIFCLANVELSVERFLKGFLFSGGCVVEEFHPSFSKDEAFMWLETAYLLLMILHLLPSFLFAPKRTSKDLEELSLVWELQRRTTIWHKDWRAPFLPHDYQPLVSEQRTFGGMFVQGVL